MGKRKNKSGKQKQKQTKKKSNSSILGKHGGKRNTDGTTAASANDIRLLCSLPKPKASNPLTSLLRSSSNNNTTSSISSSNNKPHNEQEDFHRQLNSMVERSRASDAATTAAASSRRSLGRKQQRRRKHSNVPTNTAALLSSSMKPASFSLVKSTNQLMEETMHQMGHIMSTSTGHGHGHHTHLLHPAIASGSSSLARAAASIAPSERTPIASNVHKTTMSRSTANIRGIAGIGNSFSALGATMSDSEDEEDDEIARVNSQSKSQQPRIQFAPAAFSLGSSGSTPLSSASIASSTPASRLLLPTKTPPTTPSSTPNHHRRGLETSKRASLFGTINEEEMEELHYQQQTVGLQHGAVDGQQRKGPITAYNTTNTNTNNNNGMGEHDDDL